MSLFDLTGKKALLLGYNGNFGPIFAETLRTAYASVIMFGMPECDFSDRRLADLILKDISDYFIPDIIVCNAAIDIPPSKTDARFFTEFDKILQVNLKFYAQIAEVLIPLMKNGGVFVFIGSIQGYIGADWRNYENGFEKPVGYNVSKAALKQLARSITVQYGRQGIRAVCPGFGPYLGEKLTGPFAEKIKNQIPTGKGVTKEDLQRTLLYACCCDGLAGEDWLVDGGYTKW